MSDPNIDPVLVAVLQRKLKAITEEMGLALLRTTRSPILNEARDFVTGLYDADGRMLEQTEYIPVLAFALQPVCAHLVATFGDDIHEGDVFLHNDVFSGGNQNNDVAVFVPVFHDGARVAWAACKGHQADIGGAVAGGYNPEAREVWQEALRIPAVKVYERGRLRRDVWALIFANVRLDVVEADIRAAIGGCHVGERAVQRLFARYGHAVIERHVAALFDATERRVRAAIRAMPDGVHRGESVAWDDGIRDGATMPIRLAVTVAGEAITFDFTGSAAQTPGFVNAPYAATASAVLLTFLMLIDPEIPHNDGLTRPLTLVIPEGSFLNARFPAATTFGNSLTGPTSDAIFRALAEALPERVTAGWNRMLGVTVTGHDPEQAGARFVDILFLALKGGSGAVSGCNGYDHIGLINCAGGILAQDYEMFELQNPHRLLHHEYLPDSAGVGQWRGGHGVDTAIELGGDGLTAVVFGDGVEEGARAFGLRGGGAGSLNRLEITTPDGSRIRPRSKQIVRDLPAGAVLRQQAGGGGGYGDPRARAAEEVAAEVGGGLLDASRARDLYGVVLHADGVRVDAAGTGRLRGGMA